MARSTIAPFALTVIVLCQLFGTQNAHPSPRIIQGEPAVEGQFPWIVAVYYTSSSGTSLCGGALIDESWVLTAGHCVFGVNNFTLYLGSNSLVLNDPHRVVTRSSEYIVHPEYNAARFTNDVGLIRLQTVITPNEFIRPIALDNRYLLIGNPAIVAGWGKITDDSGVVSNDLHYYSVQTISNRECDLYFPTWINENMICGKGEEEQNVCDGDSGGPLVVYDSNGNPLHAGVVSFISNQGCEMRYPAGFQRTSPYLEWIESVTGITAGVKSS